MLEHVELLASQVLFKMLAQQRHIVDN